MQARKGRKTTQSGLGAGSSQKEGAPRITQTRRKAQAVPSAQVDDVGPRAMAIARRAPGQARPANQAAPLTARRAPRLLVDDKALESAPLDPRDAFVLSFVDGHLTIESIVDASGLSEAAVASILERLERLGIVLLP